MGWLGSSPGNYIVPIKVLTEIEVEGCACVCMCVCETELVERLVGVRAGENPVTQPPATLRLKVDESLSPSVGRLLYSSRSYWSE